MSKAGNTPGGKKRGGYKWARRQMAIAHAERFENGVVSSVDTLSTPYDTRRKRGKSADAKG